MGRSIRMAVYRLLQRLTHWVAPPVRFFPPRGKKLDGYAGYEVSVEQPDEPAVSARHHQ